MGSAWPGFPLVFLALGYGSVVSGAAALMALLLLIGLRSADPGLKSLIAPFLLLLGMAIAELARLEEGLAFRSLGQAAIVEIANVFRLCLGPAWALLADRHYRLNGIKDWRTKATPVLLAVSFATILLRVLDVAGIVPPSARSASETAENLGLAVTLLYTAIVALTLPANRRELLPSSHLAIALALASAIIYPLVSLADIFRWSYPGLRPGVPVWLQSHPAYLLVLCTIVAVWAARTSGLAAVSVGFDDKVGTDKEIAEETMLTVREREIVSRLLEGRTYKESAADLGLSLATVKTHVSHAYRKIGVKNRAQLQHKLQDLQEARQVQISSDSHSGKAH